MKRKLAGLAALSLLAAAAVSGRSRLLAQQADESFTGQDAEA